MVFIHRKYTKVGYPYNYAVYSAAAKATVLTPIIPTNLVCNQWFQNLLSKQAWAAEMAAKACLDGRFKNLSLKSMVLEYSV